MKKLVIGMMVAAAVGATVAATVVDVDVAGREKISVSVNVSNAALAQSLKRNLEITGLFRIDPKGAIKITGGTGSLVATGHGKELSLPVSFTDDQSARMAARRFSNVVCERFGEQKGFALDQIAFVSRKGANNSEICVCYPDGYDIRQLTGDSTAVVGPRWQDPNHLLYTFMKNGPQIYEYDLAAKTRKLRWSFRGLTAGAAVSPDGRRVAIVLSFQGNPELYILDGTKYTRLTNTPNASEGQPTWSPDGRQIAYVSNDGRHPQIHVIDVATKKSRRLTAKGSQNVDPDWGKDGRIAYVTRRGGGYIAVMDPAKGDASAELVTKAANWEHPSWSRDGRHLVASRDKALFIVDSLKDGNDYPEPRQLFRAKGLWVMPSWIK